MGVCSFWWVADGRVNGSFSAAMIAVRPSNIIIILCNIIIIIIKSGEWREDSYTS